MQIDDYKKHKCFAWLIWGLAAAFYFSDYLARVAPGVMHRHLQITFNMNEATFGLITASFYFPYVLMQIPVGLTVDRASIRKILTLMSLITALGCIVFGLAQTVAMAALGRILIGFSAAFAFISSLRLATSWFPPVMLGLLAGLTQALGMLGAAAGEAPISFLVEATSWRSTMLIISVVFIILAVLLYKYIQDHPQEVQIHNLQESNKPSILQSLKIILSSKQTWLNALYAGFLFTPTAVIGEAIGPAYLQYGRGLSAHSAAFATGLIFIGWGIGGPLSGFLSDKTLKRKPFMIGSALLGFIFTMIFIYDPFLTSNSIYILFFLFGLTNSGVSIAYAISTEIHDKPVIGTSIAFTNMASIFVGALMQPLVGHLVDFVAGVRSYNLEQLNLHDFQFGLIVLPICTFIALCLSFTIKETNCKPVRNYGH